MLPVLLAFANFGILVALGLWFRHRPAVHKRLMLLALRSLVQTPAIHLGGSLIGLIEVLSAVGKSLGTGIVTEPVAAHSVPR